MSEKRAGELSTDERQRVTDRRISLLGRSPQSYSVYTNIASELTSCSKRNGYCDLAACIHCSLANQTQMITAVKGLWPADTPLIKATMVLSELSRNQGQLNTLNLSSIQRHLRRLFKRAEANHHIVVGFIDISFNVHAQCEWPAHWQPHLEFLTTEDDWLRMKKALRKQLTTSPSVKKPLLGVSVRDWDHQISYAFKPIPIRKTDFLKSSPKARPHKQNLKGPQELEFLLWLGNQKPSARTFLMNVRNSRNGLRPMR